MEPNDLIIKQIQELLKKSKQQTEASLAAFEKSLEAFNKAVLELGLDAEHPMNPSIKAPPLKAIATLVHGLGKIPQINPALTKQALSLFQKIKQDAETEKKAIDEEKKLQKLEEKFNFTENKNIRFAKILKAAQIQSKIYPSTANN